MRARAGSLDKLAQSFKIIDSDNSGQLSEDEFEAVLKRCNIPLQKSDITALFKLFDQNNDKSISCEEFINVLKEPLNPRRRAMVIRCFKDMDKDGSGELDIKDLKDLWCAKEHPDVIAGRKSEKQVLTEFITNMEGTSGNRDGKVTLNEFIG